MWTGPNKNLIILDISQFTNINSKLSIPNIEITLTPENLEIIQNFFNSLNKNTFNGYIDNNLFDKIKNTIKILPEDNYDIFYNSKKIKQLCWNIDKSKEDNKVINHSNNNTFKIDKYDNLNSPKKSNLIIPLESNFSFVFIITSYNNSKWVEKNLNSVIEQDYKYWRVVYIDDCSNDNTLDLVNNIVTKSNLENKFIVIKNEKNYKQAYSRYIAFKQCLDNEICCLLDGDDWLYDNTVLSKLNNLYKENDIEVTYAKFQYFENNQLGHITGHLKYPDDIKNYKNHNKWVPVHMRTGFAKLFKSIPYKYLFDHNNELLKCCTDWNEMFWVLDKSNKKHMNTGFVTYVYNKDASLTYKSSYYNAHLCEIQKNYRIELEYFLKLNQLNRYEKTKTILIFTDLDSNEEKLIKFSDTLNSDYKLIFKKKLINDVKINIDHILFFDFKNINNELLNKVKKHCGYILTNNKYEDLITFDENNIKLKLLNIDLENYCNSNNKINIVKKDFDIFNELYVDSILVNHKNNSVINKLVDKIYCINIYSNFTKLKKLLNVINNYNIDCEIIRVNKLSSSDLYMKVLQKIIDSNQSKNKLFHENPGELGITISQTLCHIDAFINGYKNIIIFEDDIIPIKNLNERFYELKDLISEQSFIYLGASQWSWDKFIDIQTNYYRPNRTCGAFALYINREMIVNLLKEYLKLIRKLDNIPWNFYNTADSDDGYLKFYKNIDSKYYDKCIVLYPNLLIADVTSSDIRNSQNQNDRNEKMKWDSTIYNFEIESKLEYNIELTNKLVNKYNLKEIINKLNINLEDDNYAILNFIFKKFYLFS